MAKSRSSGRYQVALLGPEGNHEQVWELPSVTEILDAVVAKPKLLHWYYTHTVEGFAELAKRFQPHLPTDAKSLKSLLSTEGLSPYAKRNAAAEAGTAVHKDLERLVAGKRPKPTPANQGLLNWWDERQPEVVATEYRLVNFKRWYAGTVDLIYRRGDELVLCDLKTSNNLHWAQWVQGAAYALAWEEAGNPEIATVTILHVRPVSELINGWTEQVIAPKDELVRAWLAIKEIYDMLPWDWYPEDVDD